MEINDTTFKVVVMMLVSHTAALWYIFSRCVLRIYYDEEVFLLCFPPGLLVFFASLLSTRFPSAGLSAAHFITDWLDY